MKWKGKINFITTRPQYDGNDLLSEDAGEFNALIEKATLVDDDLVIIEDSEASYAKKKAKRSNIGGGTGDVTAAENLRDNSLIRGDGGGKGIQDSYDSTAGIDWHITDLGRLYGMASFPSEMFLVILENTTSSGEFLQMLGFTGDPAHEFRQNDSGDGLMRVYMGATINSGNVYFLAQDGLVKIGDTAGTIDANFDLLIDNTGDTAQAGGVLGFKNAAGDTIGIVAPASITASWTLTLPPDDGTSGQVLQTDGSGVTSWVTPAGGGDVTAAENLTDESVVRGDGGGKGVQDSDSTATCDVTINDDCQMSIVADKAHGYALSIQNLDPNGDGFSVRAGENLGDIAFHIADSDDSFQIMELEADQGFATFGETYAQTLIDRGVVYGIDVQHSGAASDFNTQFGQYRMAGTPISLKRYVFFADQVDYPRGTNWDVNNGAPASADSNNAALKVRLFDDTTVEAIGFMVHVPGQALEMIVRTKARAETAPGGTVAAIMQLHERSIGDNAAISGWTATTLTTISIPTNENFQYDETSDDLAGWGLSAGETYQMQLSRLATSGSDTLTGDLALLSVEVEFR